MHLLRTENSSQLGLPGSLARSTLRHDSDEAPQCLDGQAGRQLRIAP